MEEIKVLVFDSKRYLMDSLSNVDHDGITFTHVETKLNKDNVSLAEGFNTILVFVHDDINKEVLTKLKGYGITSVFLRCTGYNNVDLKAAKKLGIKVYRVPAYSPNSIAEYTFALLLSLNRRIHKAYNRTKEYNFSLEDLVGSNLKSKTIGIIGLGKIGRIIAKIANGFGMRVIGYDSNKAIFSVLDDNVEYASLREIYERSDYITLHAPLTESTFHLINKDSLARMKKGVMIINTSRGALIDSKALLDAIKSRKVSSVALDVYEEEENIFYEDRSNHILDDEVLRDLIAMPNVIVTSHQAFLTKEALEEISKISISNIKNFFEGNPNKENEIAV